MFDHTPDLGSPGPAPRATRRLLKQPLDPFEQAARDMDQAAFLGALIPALIILAAAAVLIFVVGP